MTEPSPGLVADSSSEGLVAQLEAVWTAISLLCATLTTEQWDLPTSCPGWSVKDQVIHLVGTESMLAGRPTPQIPAGRSDPPFGDHVRNDIGRFNESWVVALRHLDGTEVLDRFNEVTRERLAALRALDWTAWDEVGWTPVGQAPYRRFMQIRVFDCWVHFQDIRAALGVEHLGDPGPDPDSAGIDGGAAAEQAVDEVVRALGVLIGKRAGAPAGSTVALTLTGPVHRQIFVAVDERATVVAALDAPATVRLTTDSLRFVRLACGRVPSAEVDAATGVRIEGDIDLGQRIVGHLAFTV